MCARVLQGLVFDYYVDEATCEMTHWQTRVPAFTYTPDNFGKIFVPTVESTRLTYLLSSLMARKHNVMFVGSTGTGKTAIMRNTLAAMDSEVVATATINLNSYSDAPALQPILEQPLEKKSGSCLSRGFHSSSIPVMCCSADGCAWQAHAMARRGPSSWCTL